MRHLSLGLFIAVLCSAGVRGEESPFTPVGAEMLDGNKLLLADLKLSFAAPGEDWNWFLLKSGGSTAFACRNKTRTYLLVPHELSAEFDEKEMQQIMNGAMDSAKQKHFLIGERRIDASDKPLEKRSFRLSYTLGYPDGLRKSFVHIYVLKASEKMSFIIQEVSPNKEESDEFQRLIGGVTVIP